MTSHSLGERKNSPEWSNRDLWDRSAPLIVDRKSLKASVILFLRLRRLRAEIVSDNKWKDS